MALGFLTNSEAKQKIEGLEARISELEADATARDAELVSARADFATSNESLNEANGNLATARERITALETEASASAETIARLTEEAKFTKDKVSLEASRIVAASGHKEPVESPEGGSGGVEIKTRAEFNKLDARARVAFLKSQGKLTD